VKFIHYLFVQFQFLTKWETHLRRRGRSAKYKRERGRGANKISINCTTKTYYHIQSLLHSTMPAIPVEEGQKCQPAIPTCPVCNPVTLQHPQRPIILPIIYQIENLFALLKSQNNCNLKRRNFLPTENEQHFHWKFFPNRNQGQNLLESKSTRNKAKNQTYRACVFDCDTNTIIPKRLQ